MSTYGTRQHNTKFNNKYTNYNKLYKGLCSGGRGEVFLKQKGLEMSFKERKKAISYRLPPNQLTAFLMCDLFFSSNV
jgi:hypothetical protein